MVDKLPQWRPWSPSPQLIFLYWLTHFPYLVTEVLPIGVLLSALISLGGLARNSELAAARAGGVSGIRIAAPILAAALAISILHFGISEFVISKASDYSRYIEKVLIQKRDVNFDVAWRSNMAKSLSDNRQLFCKDYDSSLGQMRQVIIITRQDQRISGRIDAQSMDYKPGAGWTLHNGVERVFNAEGDETSLRNFKQWPAAVNEGPRDFMVDSDKHEDDLVELSMAELKDIIAVLMKTGADYRKELICYYLKVSVPFSCFILALLGVSLPFLFPSGRRAVTGAAVGLLVSIGCGMLYLVCIQIGLSLGKLGYLPMLLSAWIGNLVFLGAGLSALWKASR
jgi:lipopolysaccharide export system permease protein